MTEGERAIVAMLNAVYGMLLVIAIFLAPSVAAAVIIGAIGLVFVMYVRFRLSS